MFLAGGVAFSILLAGVPFFLLLSAGVGYTFGADVDRASRAVQTVLELLLPTAPDESLLDPILVDVVRTRAAAGIGGAIGFLWFSTRLFGSLRSVMSVVFERRDRGFFRGKLWDIYLTVSSAVLVTFWVVVSAWLAVSSGRVGTALTDAGMRAETLSGMQYAVGRLIAISIIVAIFFSMYRWLPARRTPWIPALAGGVAAAGLFELARYVFALVIHNFPPATLYTGTLGALIIVVFWTYYAAIIFVLGAEVANGMENVLEP